MAEDPQYSSLERRVNFLEYQVNRLTREQILSAELQALGSAIEARFDAISARIENRFTALSNQIGELTVRSYDVSVKVGSLENVQGTILGLVREMNGRFGNIETRVAGVETHMEGLETRVAGVETRMEGLETRVAGVETRMEGLETRVNSLGLHIGRLESRMVSTEGKLDTVISALVIIQETLGRMGNTGASS